MISDDASSTAATAREQRQLLDWGHLLFPKSKGSSQHPPLLQQWVSGSRSGRRPCSCAAAPAAVQPLRQHAGSRGDGAHVEGTGPRGSGVSEGVGTARHVL